MHFKSGRYTKTWLFVCAIVCAQARACERRNQNYTGTKEQPCLMLQAHKCENGSNTRTHILAKKHTVRHAETKKNTQSKKLTSMHEQLHM